MLMNPKTSWFILPGSALDALRRLVIVSGALLIFGALFPLNYGYADLCPKWGGGKEIGQLDHTLINEASGLAVSAEFPDRLYHINDSGGGPHFYVTDMEGNDTKKVRIQGFNKNGADFEDLSIGRCSSNSACLVIADIGDNREKRQYVELIVIKELENFADSATPLKTIKLVYPDGAHNAEGMAVHPGGDIYILTKEEDLDKLEAYPSKLYRLDYKKRLQAGKEPVKLEYIGEIDIPGLIPESSHFGQIVTSFDISPEGGRFLVLTYENAVEFNIPHAGGGLKTPKELKSGMDYRIIELGTLPQQESVAYMPDGKGFIYNTEYKIFSVPIIMVRCL